MREWEWNIDILLGVWKGWDQAELRMHSFTVNCDTFSNDMIVAAVVPVTSVEVTCSEAMLAHSFSTLLLKRMMKILGWSALW